MSAEAAFRYTHVEAGLVENVVIRNTTDTEAYPSGWKYTLHLGTLEDLTLVRYDNAHEDTEGHDLYTATGRADVAFPGMEERLVEFWTTADEYWEATSGDPPRPYLMTSVGNYRIDRPTAGGRTGKTLH